MAESKIKGEVRISGHLEDGYKYLYYEKIGRVAMIQISNGTYTGTELFTLPAELKPLLTVDMLDSYSKERIQINPSDGKIVSTNTLNNKIIRLSTTYLTAT